MLFYLCADSSHLGRLDYASLSQQALMEMVIAGIKNKEQICLNADAPADCTEWNLVTIDTNGDALVLLCSQSNLVGSIDLEWLPPTIRDVDFSFNYLTGTLNFEYLPELLKELSVHFNEFFGTVCLTKLPKNIQELSIGGNKFNGTVDLTKLPPSITHLFLYDNAFEGSTDFSKLPESLRCLDIAKTRLSGKHRERPGLEVIVSGSRVHIIGEY